MPQYKIVKKCSYCNHKTAIEMVAGIAKCKKCERVFSDLEIIEFQGYVYLLSNACMSHLVKVGFTERNVESRIQELNSTTSIAKPFEIEAYFLHINPRAIEQEIHSRLSDYRVNNNREFFKLTAQKALAIMKETIGYDPEFIGEDLLMLEHSTRSLNMGHSSNSNLLLGGIFVNNLPKHGRSATCVNCRITVIIPKDVYSGRALCENCKNWVFVKNRALQQTETTASSNNNHNPSKIFTCIYCLSSVNLLDGMNCRSILCSTCGSLNYL